MHCHSLFPIPKRHCVLKCHTVILTLLYLLTYTVFFFSEYCKPVAVQLDSQQFWRISQNCIYKKIIYRINNLYFYYYIPIYSKGGARRAFWKPRVRCVERIGSSGLVRGAHSHYSSRRNSSARVFFANNFLGLLHRPRMGLDGLQTIVRFILLCPRG